MFKCKYKRVIYRARATQPCVVGNVSRRRIREQTRPTHERRYLADVLFSEEVRQIGNSVYARAIMDLSITTSPRPREAAEKFN